MGMFGAKRVVAVLVVLAVAALVLLGACDLLNGLQEEEESENTDGSSPDSDDDASDGDSTDESGGVMEVTSPNDGDTWQTGGRETIEWNGAVDGESVNIDLYDRGSWHAHIVDDTENDGTYSWAIPSDLEASAFYSIYVESDSTDAEDESEQFTIELAPYIQLKQPEGGDSWGEGHTKTISWDSSGAGDYVKIELYYGGSMEQTVTSSTANDGAYSWDVDCLYPQPADPGSYDPDYRIKITSKSNASISAFSGYFEIWQ